MLLKFKVLTFTTEKLQRNKEEKRYERDGKEWHERKKGLTKGKKYRENREHIPFRCNNSMLKRWIFKGISARKISQGATAISEHL